MISQTYVIVVIHYQNPQCGIASVTETSALMWNGWGDIACFQVYHTVNQRQKLSAKQLLYIQIELSDHAVRVYSSCPDSEKH